MSSLRGGVGVLFILLHSRLPILGDHRRRYIPESKAFPIMPAPAQPRQRAWCSLIRSGSPFVWPAGPQPLPRSVH
eukprot:4606793-Pyramimonas_sp.AAC.2